MYFIGQNAAFSAVIYNTYSKYFVLFNILSKFAMTFKHILYMKEEISLVEQAQRDILKYISDSKDSRLPKEQELVEKLGVSRVVVREALSRLRAVGII